MIATACDSAKMLQMSGLAPANYVENNTVSFVFWDYLFLHFELDKTNYDAASLDWKPSNYEMKDFNLNNRQCINLKLPGHLQPLLG